MSIKIFRTSLNTYIEPSITPINILLFEFRLLQPPETNIQMETVPPEDYDNLERNTGLADINSLENRLAMINHERSRENNERTLNSSLSG